MAVSRRTLTIAMTLCVAALAYCMWSSGQAEGFDADALKKKRAHLAKQLDSLKRELSVVKAMESEQALSPVVNQLEAKMFGLMQAMQAIDKKMASAKKSKKESFQGVGPLSTQGQSLMASSTGVTPYNTGPGGNMAVLNKQYNMKRKVGAAMRRAQEAGANRQAQFGELKAQTKPLIPATDQLGVNILYTMKPKNGNQDLRYLDPNPPGPGPAIMQSSQADFAGLSLIHI